MGVARSGIGWLIAKYGTLVLSFLAVMYFTRALPNPTETLGLFQVFETGISLVMFTTSAGLGTAVIKRTSEGDAVGAITGATFRITLFLLVVLTAVLVVLSGPITDYFGYGLVLLGLFIATIWGKQIAEMASAIIQGHGLVARSGGVDLLEMAVRVIVQIALIFLGFELLGLVGGAALGTLAAAVAALWIMPKNFSKPEGEHYKRLFSFTKFSFFRGFAGKVYNNVDVLVIAWFIGNSAVALYAIPYRLTLALDAFTSSIRSSILPAVSRNAKEGESERVRELLQDAFIFSTILAIPAAVGVAILTRPLIVTLFTEDLAGGAIIAVFAMVIQVPQAIRTVSATALDGVDRPDVALRGDVVLIVTNVVLDVALVPILGIEGAAIGTLVASTASAAYYLNSTITVLELEWSFFPVREIGEQFVAAVGMGAVVHITFHNLPGGQLVALGVAIVVGVLVYGGLLTGISSGARRRIRGILGDFVNL